MSRPRLRIGAEFLCKGHHGRIVDGPIVRQVHDVSTLFWLVDIDEGGPFPLDERVTVLLKGGPGGIGGWLPKGKYWLATPDMDLL